MSIPSEQVVAIIPARGGSKGIPGKNLRKIGGVPLVGRSVQAALKAERIGSVYVSSDSLEILTAGEQHGALSILRPSSISGDQASSESALLHSLEEIEKAGGKPSIVVFIQCTSPFLDPEDLNGLVDALSNPDVSAALTVTADHGFLWKRDSTGVGIGVNHDETKPRQRRQEMDPQYRENGAAYAMRVADFRRVGRRFCGKVALVETTMPTIEIDEPADFAVAEAWEKAKLGAKSPPSTLQSIRALVTDFDGVHTNDSASVDETGKESVMCSRADGFGIARLREAGLKFLILSKERNPVVAARARKLKVECLQAIDDKASALLVWAKENQLDPKEIAYIGNDLNDLSVMGVVGMPAAPSDARPEVLEFAKWKLLRAGGHGCIREACDLILEQFSEGRDS